MHASRRSLALVASVAALVVPAFASAQTVPGEKWKQSVTMEMGGMKIPARTMEVCVPIGKAEEALARPPDNQNCTTSNVKRSGNTFSADIACTGKDAVKGHIESTTEGNRTIGKMRMQMEGMGEMTMNFDSTKLGTSCQAVDVAAVSKKVEQQAATQMSDLCNDFSNRFTKDPRELVAAAGLYADKNGQCATHATKKNFCSAVQTPSGFLGLSNQERSMGKSGPASYMTTPLTLSLQSCSLGSADALRTKLLGTAEKENNWDFLVAEGNDTTWQMLTTTARRECAGRSFTNAPPTRYADLCRKYGVALTRGDRDAARQAAGVMGSSGSSGGSAQGRATVVEDTPETAAAGSAEPAADEPQKGKTRDALDKGKKKLKSLFGGGGD